MAGCPGRSVSQSGAGLLDGDRRGSQAGEAEQPRRRSLQRGWRPGQELPRGRVADDPAAVHRHDAVGGGEAALEPVLGQDDRGPPLLVDAPEHAEQLVAGDRVELGGRLVEQEQLRPPRQRGAERDALQLRHRRARGSRGRAARRCRARARPPPPRARPPPHRVRGSPTRTPAPRGPCRAPPASRAPGRASRTPPRDRPGRARGSRGPRPRGARRTRRRGTCGTRPEAARSSVDFPEPVAPASTTNSPGSTVSDTESSAGAAASGYR